VGSSITFLNRRLLGASLLLPALLCATPAFAQAQTTNGTANASIVAVGGLINTTSLDFGSVISTGAAGTVTVAPTGIRTTTGGALPAGGTFHAAAFAGQGARRNQQITIAFGAASIVIKRVGGTETMVVNNFTINSPPSATLAVVAAGARYRIVPANAIYEFPVGARLNVGVNQRTGVYEGKFSVTVNYQ
jgi:Domain of unknown function (DUF4402)